MKVCTIAVGLLVACVATLAAERSPLLTALQARPQLYVRKDSAAAAPDNEREKRSLLLGAGAGALGLGALGLLGAGALGVGAIGLKAGFVGGALAAGSLGRSHGGWGYGGYGGYGGYYGRGYGGYGGYRSYYPYYSYWR